MNTNVVGCSMGGVLLFRQLALGSAELGGQ
jgi:hypothetical protein